MKVFKWITGAVFVAGMLASLRAEDRTYGAYLINNPTLSYSTTAVVNTDQFEDLSFQAIYSSATISPFSFLDGTFATGQITFVSTSSLTGMRVGIGGYNLDEGTEWTAVATTTGCAAALNTAIGAKAGLSSLIGSSVSGSVVYATAAALGTSGNAISMYSSKSSSVTISGSKFTGGVEPAVSITGDTVNLPSHKISTGFPMYLTTVTGTAPTGLTDGTTYYAIAKDQNNIQLATTSVLSLAGTAVDITALTGVGSFSLTPTAFDGTWGFYWQASNDNSNWYTLSASSVTYSVPANYMWDGPIYSRYLRLNFSAGTGGGLNLKVLGNGKRRQ